MKLGANTDCGYFVVVLNLAQLRGDSLRQPAGCYLPSRREAFYLVPLTEGEWAVTGGVPSLRKVVTFASDSTMRQPQ